ncbi:MAG: SPOR domain-containing protein [Sphingobacterium composti]|uniref:SPOR domain-containing protein n=1 Tax=Sphingobacterium composti TaxID=363260 RepID=UPI0013581FE5|nr:SPOR domain-containing protein [Sphingobacterium composti Ten et al. 2007 non Yoo et al. 2007]
MLYQKGLILVSAICLMFIQAKGQESNSVIVQQDSLITLLQNFRAAHEINPTTARLISLGTKPVDKSKATRVKRKGFRVQIYAGSNRSDAYAMQARFKNQFSDMDTYISYSEPNYRVKVGDFRSRAQATEFMNSIRSLYKSVFIFQEDIWVWE